MADNMAATLTYGLGWLTGLLFYFIDKRPYVRFHATQSIVVFGGLHIIRYALGVFFGSTWPGGHGEFLFGFGLCRLIDVVALTLWIFLMVKANQGLRFRIPVATDLVESLFGKS
jgi:uncharacterized membrane protein